MKRLITIIAAIPMVALAFAMQHAEAEPKTVPTEAVVKVKNQSGGILTGVIVSADGWVLSAEHGFGTHDGNRDKVVEVNYMGKILNARIVVDGRANRVDEAIVLKLPETHAPYKYIKIAKANVTKNGFVWSMGYCRGKFGIRKGNVYSTTKDYTITSIPIKPGDSGGPLLHEDQIVGLASSRSQRSPVNPYDDTTFIDSRFISLKSIHSQYARRLATNKHRATPERRKPVTKTVVVFSADWCGPCRKFQRDAGLGPKGGVWNGINFVIVKEGTTEHDQYRAQFRQRYGRNPAYPTFWSPQTGEYTAGYSGAPELLRRLHNVLAKILNIVPQAIAGGNLFPEIDGARAQPLPPRENIQGIRDDIERLKDGSVLEKLPAIVSLRNHISDLKQHSEALKESVDSHKDAIVAIIDRVHSDAEKAAVVKAKVEEVHSKASELKAAHESEGTMGVIGWILTTVLGGAGTAAGLRNGMKA